MNQIYYYKYSPNAGNEWYTSTKGFESLISAIGHAEKNLPYTFRVEYFQADLKNHVKVDEVDVKVASQAHERISNALTKVFGDPK